MHESGKVLPNNRSPQAVTQFGLRVAFLTLLTSTKNGAAGSQYAYDFNGLGTGVQRLNLTPSSAAGVVC
mgnify:CR=1 FL=1